jgi:hypothetical protein
MRITKSLMALIDAMCQSEIELTKIARTLKILGFQTQSIRKMVETKDGVKVEQGRERVEHADESNRIDEESLESSPCDICFYVKKVIGFEEELSRLRLDLNRLHTSVVLLDEEIHRRPRSC